MRRSTSTFALLLLTAGAITAMGCRKTLAVVPLRWESDVEVAFAKGKAENKPVVVYFGADWDNAAKELEHQTFVDPVVRTLLWRDFIAVHVDSTDDEEPSLRKLSERFKVVGDPTIVIMSANGVTELRRVNEFVPPEKFAPMLRAATRSDAAREARFETAARQRAEERSWELRWQEERRNADRGIFTGPVDLIPIAE